MKLAVKIVADLGDTFRAWCPALPCCVVWGASREEAKRELKREIQDYLDMLNGATVEQGVALCSAV